MNVHERLQGSLQVSSQTYGAATLFSAHSPCGALSTVFTHGLQSFSTVNYLYLAGLSPQEVLGGMLETFVSSHAAHSEHIF